MADGPLTCLHCELSKVIKARETAGDLDGEQFIGAVVEVLGDMMATSPNPDIQSNVYDFICDRLKETFDAVSNGEWKPDFREVH